MCLFCSMAIVGLSRNDHRWWVRQASLDTLFFLILVLWSVEVQPNAGQPFSPSNGSSASSLFKLRKEVADLDAMKL